MQFQPFENHFQCSCRHLTLYNAIFNAYYCLIVTIPCIKMCRRIVTKIHKNYNPIKETYLWHTFFFVVKILLSIQFSKNLHKNSFLHHTNKTNLRMLILSKDSANREQNSHARLSFFAEMQLILSKDSANRTLLHSISPLIIPNIFAS